MMRTSLFILALLMFSLLACKDGEPEAFIYTVQGKIIPDGTEKWLTHEHILVDFIGADSIHSDRWNRSEVVDVMQPYMQKVREQGVGFFVDATPEWLGRDPELLRTLSENTDIHIITNTGYYGARANKFIHSTVRSKSPEQLAKIWIEEFREGIGNSGIRPGFIKIAVDVKEPLDSQHVKLVKAAAITHKETGLTIGSHTGRSEALWPQLEILKEYDVSPEAFIWIHADNEKDFSQYLKAAEEGCWISIDKFGWKPEAAIERLLFAKESGILDHILISHDAGWFDPAREAQNPRGFNRIFEESVPELKAKGFTDEDLDLLLIENPVEAFGVKKRMIPENQ